MIKRAAAFAAALFTWRENMKLQKGTLSDFEMVYRDMVDQFPAEELKPKSLLADLIARGKYDLWLAQNNGQTVGYLLICPWQEYLWLDYIAVFQHHQSHGYGSRMISLLTQAYPAHAGMFLEVEHETPLDINTLRRARFYRNLGADILFNGYLLPTEKGGFPMALFFLSRTETVPPREKMLGMIRYAFDTIHSNIPERDAIFEEMKKEL